MSAGGAPSRTGGRTSRVLNAIYTSVGELVAEGATKISFPIVAERAGVNPTTLYRRWHDVDALLEEVSVAALTRDGETVPDTGSLVRDLSAWANVIAADITRPQRVRYLRAMVSARPEVVASCPVMEIRRAQASEMVLRAEHRGESAPTVEQILDHVIAPMYHRIAFALPLEPGYADQLVRDVMIMADR